MRHAGNGLHGHRLRGAIVVLWRAGLRIHEALALGEADGVALLPGLDGRKMSKSYDNTVALMADPDVTGRRIRRIITDSNDHPSTKRGVTGSMVRHSGPP